MYRNCRTCIFFLAFCQYKHCVCCSDKLPREKTRSPRECAFKNVMAIAKLSFMGVLASNGYFIMHYNNWYCGCSVTLLSSYAGHSTLHSKITLQCCYSKTPLTLQTRCQQEWHLGYYSACLLWSSSYLPGDPSVVQLSFQKQSRTKLRGFLGQ